MIIKKLRLSGFKSFVEPAELHIQPGLTGVVGPNGCGKSNLLEAIRWVMGENSPKSMRSGGMDDVIFAGTTQRPPRDFAEVVLQGEDADRQDLEVMRRIERGAGSAYRVNGRDVRAKDVALTFADAATGAHSPALVSQGKIAQVIAAKPTERRQMLEEAAGIAGLHVRRRDAENKLRQTEKNLARLEDLMAGLDSQIASLRRQAKQAERYKKLSEQITNAEARLIYARWRDACRSAEEAQAAAKAADSRVDKARQTAATVQAEQHRLASDLAAAREELADRRDDASAHGHRMAALTSKLEAAEQRLTDLDRQKQRLEADRGDADRVTRDAAEALSRIEREVAANERQLADDEAARPAMANDAEKTENAARKAELALAKATADHAGVEAEWRVAEAAITQAKNRLARLDAEAQRQSELRLQPGQQQALEKSVSDARSALKSASAKLQATQVSLEQQRAEKADLAQARDAAADQLAQARAELSGAERELQALERDRAARAKQASGKHGLPRAIDGTQIDAGYERALAAVLGRDAKAGLGAPQDDIEGRFWTGGPPPQPLSDSLADKMTRCPPQLAARLALVRVAERDDGRELAPGEWLVTKAGALRRWDGFIARGEGAAEAALLEAGNRHSELERALPPMLKKAEAAEAQHNLAQATLSALQQSLVASERTVNQATDAERAALRIMDQAESEHERAIARDAELERAAGDLEEQRTTAQSELNAAQKQRASLPEPETGRSTLEAEQAKNEAARSAVQSALAQLAAHDQALAVARERVAAQRADIISWQARSEDAVKRLADTASRFDEIEQERAITAAKPAGLIEEIEQGDAVRKRLSEELAAAEAKVAELGQFAGNADRALSEANEALAQSREARAGLTARAENEQARQSEMARVSGERFQCPPPLLLEKYSLDEAGIKSASAESEEMERLTTSRERIGPVNLVATEELAKLEGEHGSNAAEQAELAEAVNRLRGSIGNLNREGRARLRDAFEKVDTHFRRLFTRLFDGGQAHLALIDSDDPLEAGLEIYAQPPGKRLQSLTLLSGGEQALTAIALIFALFLTNPAPICVLDEVDAPLDDANIERFCDLLDAMTMETQTRYLIVTHNAVTMSRMHRLFGVTMIEKGVSRLVSVDLGEAELLAAE